MSFTFQMQMEITTLFKRLLQTCIHKCRANIFLLSRPDFFTAYRGMHVANSCLGKGYLNLTMSVNGSASKLHHLCDLSKPIEEISFETVLYVARRLLCWTNVVIFYLNLWNFTECIIYIRIFGFMRR